MTIPCRLLICEGLSIWEQLQIEEALLRTDPHNWCILNKNAPDAIVMGISGKPSLLIDQSTLDQKPVPIIKRFSGGGTVYIDSDTVLVTFIGNTLDFSLPSQSKAIMEWSATFYSSCIPELSLRENDYVIKDKKCGGNAQYLQKNRWLHHTSFLWDFSSEKMNYLLLPQKRPDYRQDRAHADFLCTLRTAFTDKEIFLKVLVNQLHAQFKISPASLEEACVLLSKPHRKTTCRIN